MEVLRVGYRDKATKTCGFFLNTVLDGRSQNDPLIVADREGQVAAYLATPCKRCEVIHSPDEFEVFQKDIVKI
jgi:hypothetical protein